MRDDSRREELEGDLNDQTSYTASGEYFEPLATCLERKEENTMQMVRVLQGRVKALTNFIGLKHRCESINIPTASHDIEPINERSEIGSKTLDTDDNATKSYQDEKKMESPNLQSLDYTEDSDEEFDYDEAEDSHVISSLAYRNPRTPYTDAERRIESLFKEYEDESNRNENIHTRRKSAAKLHVQEIAAGDKHRKLIIQSLLSRLENNSSQYLTRASNSIIFQVQSSKDIEWPIPISDKEMNPSLLLQVSLKTKISQLYPQMIAIVTESQPPPKRDLFFRTYPLVVAKAIYLGLSYLCPGNTSLFKGTFQRVLFHSIFRLLTSVDICASTVDFLRQNLYLDDDVNVRVDREADSRTKRGSIKDGPIVEVDGLTEDVPRQQQRVAFDSYKISHLLESYLGGDAKVQRSSSMIQRTVPTEQCAVGGVNTYRRAFTQFARDVGERDRRSEARASTLKRSVREKAKARQTLVALNREEQNLFIGNRKSRREYADRLLRQHEQERKLALVTRSSMKSNYPIT